MVMEEHPKVGRGAPANPPCVAAPAPAPAAAFKSSKKNTKPKKIPQRGLGVAQLEKLRCLEGLQMNGGACASSAHGFGLPVEPRDASTFFIRPPAVHDLLAAASFSGQQQHRPPPPPPPPPSIFPTFWNADHPNSEPSFIKKTERPVPNSNARLISLAQTIPMVNSVVDHLTELPSNQNTPNIYDLRTSYWREREKNLLEMLGNKRPWSSRLDGVHGQAPYYPHRHHFLSRDEGSSRGMANSLQKRSDDCSSANGTNSSKLEFQDVRANTSDLCLETRNTEDGSFLSLGLVSPPNLRSIDNSQYHHSDFNLQNLQQKNSSNGRPFYNFFPSGTFRNEKMPSENIEALDGDIDLNLKL